MIFVLASISRYFLLWSIPRSIPTQSGMLSLSKGSNPCGRRSLRSSTRFPWDTFGESGLLISYRLFLFFPQRRSRGNSLHPPETATGLQKCADLWLFCGNYPGKSIRNDKGTKDQWLSCTTRQNTSGIHVQLALELHSAFQADFCPNSLQPFMPPFMLSLNIFGNVKPIVFQLCDTPIEQFVCTYASRNS